MIRPGPVRLLTALSLLAGLLMVSGCSREQASSVHLDSGTPVILISVDTLRSDHLPMYGYPAIRTPALDRLREDSVLFRRAYSQVPLTLPSHCSILTGLAPDHHGVRSNVGYRLASDTPSLPRLLASQGYATGAAVSAWVLRRETGLGEQFDFYDDAVGAATGFSVADVQRPGAKTASVAEKWIGEHQSQPFFFMLHLYEPHTPYEPPADLAGQYQQPYDGEIVDTDRIVGRFLDRLRREGIYDRALIIFLSDHGEGLDDHGEPGHGIFLYREAIQVPLLIKLPKETRRGDTVREPVGLTDVAPTVLSLLNLDAPASMTGRSALGPLTADRPIYAETFYPRLQLGWSQLRSIVSGDHQYIEAPRPELYDVIADPAEKNNVLSEQRRVYAALRRHLDNRSLALAAPAAVSSEDAAKLAALGYLGSSASTDEEALPDPKDRIGDLGKLIDAMNLASSGKRAEAIIAFRQIVDANPRLVEAWLELGRLLVQQGRLLDALDAYQRVMKISPTSSGETALSIAQIMIWMERYQEAEDHISLGESVNPARAMMMRTQVALGREHFADAARLAREVPEGVMRNDADVLLARALIGEGKLAEAMKVVEATAARTIGRGDHPPEGLLFVQGDILARMNRLDDASTAFQKAIEINPRDTLAYSNLAVVHFLQGDLEGAREWLARMVAANPGETATKLAAKTLHQIGDETGAAHYR